MSNKISNKRIIKQTYIYIRNLFLHEASGHDWWHIYRTLELARRIGKIERANMFIVEMAVLLHDLGDYKLERDYKDRQREKVEIWLKRMRVLNSDQEKILNIVENISFNKNIKSRRKLSLEGKVAQDADRLDAMGAIGIARTFVYTGAKGKPMYNPHLKIKFYKSTKDYQQRHSTGIQHFYEKLLLLKDCINTRTAMKMAVCRHKFIEQYLKEFFMEWKGIK